MVFMSLNLLVIITVLKTSSLRVRAVSIEEMRPGVSDFSDIVDPT